MRPLILACIGRIVKLRPRAKPEIDACRSPWGKVPQVSEILTLEGENDVRHSAPPALARSGGLSSCQDEGGLVPKVYRMSVHPVVERVMKGLRRRLFPCPVGARHAEYSMLFSEDDALSRPSPRLFDIALSAIACARHTDLQDVTRRLETRLRYPDEAINVWPGEHYRLLAALVETLKPQIVIEIGTAEGISALSLRKYLPPEGKVITFDIVPWADYPRTCLQESDFQDG